MSGHSEVAKVLLDNGVNVNHENKYGRTALMIAMVKGYSRSDESVVRQWSECEL
ncbi:MAG: ankyrin repeat domain-containing protein [Gammaproteobacteria bacterium WSBS_2016_MAG_OTU1]